jgi:signal transduction histidine kinase
LYELLKQNQDRLVGNSIVAEQNVKIKCRQNSVIGVQEGEPDDDVLERFFNITTVNVDWDGVPSCMHVFIDNSDILKLEQAKTNMKCQRIMFASASHEFRTPLNAIVNSFVFINDTF